MPKLSTTERRAEILKIMQELGIHNVPITALSQKYGCSRQTLHKDVTLIIQQTPPDDITHIKWGLQNSYKKCEKELMKILANPESSAAEKINAARTLSSIMKDYTLLLESYALKPIMATKQEVTVQGNAKLNIDDVKRLIEDDAAKTQ